MHTKKQQPLEGENSSPLRITLNQEQIQEMRNLSVSDAMKKYGISRTTLWRVRSGKQNWICPNYQERISSTAEILDPKEIQAAREERSIVKKQRYYLNEQELTWNSKKIAAVFDVSEATASQAKRRDGHFLIPGAREQVHNLNPDVANANTENITEAAKIGVKNMVSRLLGRKVDPSVLDDLVQDATVKLLLLSGDENFSNRSWRIQVAQNAAVHSIRKLIGFSKRHKTLLPED